MIAEGNTNTILYCTPIQKIKTDQYRNMDKYSNRKQAKETKRKHNRESIGLHMQNGLHHHQGQLRPRC